MELISVIKNLFTYDFIVKAFEVGIIVSLCSALLGVSLVLKRYSMIGDGLSHVSFGAISVAVAFGFAPLAVSIPVVIIAAFAILRMRENGRMHGDAAIITVPQVDFNLLKELAKKFGWVIQTEKKSGIEEALEDVKAGRVYHAKDAHDLIKQCLE